MAADKDLIIGDRTYHFGMVPPIESIEVQSNIIKIIGEPLFKALTGAKAPAGGNGEAPAEMSDEEMEQAGIAAIALLTKNLDAKVLISLTTTVFKYTSMSETGKQPVRIDMNQHFLGRNLELWKVFIGGLRYNFQDFFPASLFGSIAGKVQKYVDSRS
jgi:hypothetical protein